MFHLLKFYYKFDSIWYNLNHLLDNMNITEATRRAVERYPYLRDYILLGIVNTRALSRELKMEISQELGEEINVNSITTSLRRIPSPKKFREQGTVNGILSRSLVNLKYDIGAITINFRPDSLAKILLHQKLEGKIDDLILLQGVETLTIVTNEENLQNLAPIIKDDILEMKKSLSGIIVKSPREIAGSTGVIASLSNVLAFEKINIVEMMSSYTETYFVVEEKDALKAVEAIRKKIKRARGGNEDFRPI